MEPNEAIIQGYMIITFILTIFGGIWSGVFSLLPTGSLPAAVSSSIVTVVSWLYVADVVVDIDSLLYLLGLYFTIEAIIQATHFFFWVFSKIPIIGK